MSQDAGPPEAGLDTAWLEEEASSLALPCEDGAACNHCKPFSWLQHYCEPGIYNTKSNQDRNKLGVSIWWPTQIFYWHFSNGPFMQSLKHRENQTYLIFPILIGIFLSEYVVKLLIQVLLISKNGLLQCSTGRSTKPGGWWLNFCRWSRKFQYVWFPISQREHISHPFLIHATGFQLWPESNLRFYHWLSELPLEQHLLTSIHSYKYIPPPTSYGQWMSNVYWICVFSLKVTAA